VSRRDNLLLRAAALWTVFVWGIFLRNLLFGDTDRSTGFKVVHSVLAVVSLAFAAGIWSVASRSRRRVDDRAGTP
jgi:ABC-type thiamin/hydroxymethylpyrimidine transport system permease subunit